MGRKWLRHGLVVLLLFMLATGITLASGEMRVYYFDVGQAESTLLLGPGFTILIDAGNLGENDVVGYLQKLQVSAIDLFILTHPHADHIGQAVAVLDSFAVDEVWMSGYEHPTALFEDVLDAILRSDAYYYEPQTGEKFTFGELDLYVLNPAEIGSNLHASNIVVRAVYGDIAFLFTGDAERRSERDMIRQELPLTADVLQLGHHGSRTSSSLEFLLAVRPETAIYSAGVNNSFGHPHSEVLNRLKILDVPTYGTDCNGTIIVQTDGQDYIVYTETGMPLWEVGECLAGLPDPNRVELNTASFTELQRIIHIGPERAREIIALRQVHALRSVDDLKWVSGLGVQRIEEIKEQGLAYVKGSE